MKKIFYVVLTILAINSNLNSQHISLGLEGGINNSDVKSSGFDDFTTKPVINYFVGVTTVINTSSRIKFATDVNYSVKGYEFGVSRSRFNYLMANPMILLEINKNFDLGIGGYYGFKLNESQKGQNTGWFSTDEINFIKSSDYGITGIVKVNFRQLYIKLGYEIGIQNIQDEVFTDENGMPINYEFNNRNFRLGLGYMIN